jgi:hypothetical protein
MGFKVIVSYFDVDKYQKDCIKYHEDEKIIHTNRLISPTEKGWGPYLRDVEIETDKFKIYDDLIEDQSPFSYVVETDDDYLYHEKLNGKSMFMSHIHTFRVANYYFKKYGNPNIINLSEGVFEQIERDLKIKQIIE